MDEIWERAVETALEGQKDNLAVRALTLDGAVKCIQGRLPAAPSLFEKFENLQHLSIASIGVSTLEQFPRLGNLEKLILSDNRISGGLEFLVEAGLESLRDLDLSNNRIQYIEDLAPLAKLRLVSLDLYECPVTRVKDYRAKVFGLISSLKYLDKMDAEENERPESDDDDDVVEVHEIGDDSDEDNDAVEFEEGEEDDDDDEEGEEEEVDNDEGDLGEPESTGRLTSTEGEIDGHEHGEDDGEEDDNGETGDEEQGVEDDDGEFDDEEDGEEEDEDSDEGYLVQPVGQAEVHQSGVSDLEPVNEEDDPEGEEEVDDDDELQMLPSSSHHKRKRDEDKEDSEDDDDDVVEYTKSSSKKHL